MKKSIYLLLPIAAAMAVSCNNGVSPQEQALQQANDSLQQANAEIRSYYEEMIGYITEIDADMQAIKSAENFVIEQSADTGDITVSAQSRIKKDIEFMANTLQRNRERIAELEKKLKTSNANSAALRKSIEQLKSQLAEKDALIVELQPLDTSHRPHQRDTIASQRHSHTRRSPQRGILHICLHRATPREQHPQRWWTLQQDTSAQGQLQPRSLHQGRHAQAHIHILREQEGKTLHQPSRRQLRVSTRRRRILHTQHPQPRQLLVTHPLSRR